MIQGDDERSVQRFSKGDHRRVNGPQREVRIGPYQLCNPLHLVGGRLNQIQRPARVDERRFRLRPEVTLQEVGDFAYAESWNDELKAGSPEEFLDPPMIGV